MFPVPLYLTPRAIASREALGSVGSSLDQMLLTSCLYLLFCCCDELMEASSRTGSANHRRGNMGDVKPEIREYRLTTAEIIYHLPDHPNLLQSFVWQKLHLPPEFPHLPLLLD